jgi:hypothetical protein
VSECVSGGRGVEGEQDKTEKDRPERNIWTACSVITFDDISVRCVVLCCVVFCCAVVWCVVLCCCCVVLYCCCVVVVVVVRL